MRFCSVNTGKLGIPGMVTSMRWNVYIAIVLVTDQTMHVLSRAEPKRLPVAHPLIWRDPLRTRL